MNDRVPRRFLRLLLLPMAAGCTASNPDPMPPRMPAVVEEAGFAGPRTVNQELSGAYLSPEESLATFRLPIGYRLELVASEPMIREPVAIAWDGNGRMYVAQMETYMQTLDGRGQYEPQSRIMRLEDTDGDGRMDRSSVFIDGLVLPRMLLTVGHELFVNETNSYDIHAYRDTDGDGVADRKRLAYRSDQRVAHGNLEHQRSGLDWNLDNWIYVTMDPVRFRYRAGMLVVDSVPTGINGQWGLTHDDYGRLYFSRAASGIPASGFQINPAYGQLELPDAYEAESFEQVWPITATPDIFAGARGLRPGDSTMVRYTAASGQSIFRGDRLPPTLVGDYLVAEPVGRLIRRANVIHRGGKTALENVYEQEEFIASTDLNFRPVNTATGPDGTLYVVDMHRGIIQEGSWVDPDGELAQQIRRLGLEDNVGRGRIYRLVHEGMDPAPMPRMLEEPASRLVTYLDHPNGWWRDNAQKEIIVRGDRSVVPALRRIAGGEPGPLPRNPSPLGRIHALWTLDGLGEIDSEILLQAMEDEDAQVRRTAVWISEGLLRQGDSGILSKLAELAADADADVRTQVVLTLSRQGNSPGAAELAAEIRSRYPDDPMLAAIEATLDRNQELRRVGARMIELDETGRERVARGGRIYASLCAACHGPAGEGVSTDVAPPLVGKVKLAQNPAAAIKILLHGLTGPVEGKTYPGPMPAMGSNDDEWIAAVLSYVRLNMVQAGFPAGFASWAIVTPEQVKKVREGSSGREAPWTWEELR